MGVAGAVGVFSKGLGVPPQAKEGVAAIAGEAVALGEGSAVAVPSPAASEAVGASMVEVGSATLAVGVPAVEAVAVDELEGSVVSVGREEALGEEVAESVSLGRAEIVGGCEGGRDTEGELVETEETVDAAVSEEQAEVEGD